MKLIDRLVRRRDYEEEHARIGRRLDATDAELRDMAVRLRNLELEAGIYKPPLLPNQGDERPC